MGLNEQKPPNSIEWTRVYGRRGWTWNPIGGCLHACRWQMPDGTIAQCYAETVAEGVARGTYPQGFAHHYWHPERLDEPIKLKEPGGIFLDSMSDLMGHWIPDEQIEQVLTVCRQTPQHIYFLLTKNAPRLKRFAFPDNVWVGASSPPDFYMGKALSQQQRERMLTTTLETLTEVKAPVRWVSFEPLSWDVSPIVSGYPNAIQWAVIGAASSGKLYFPPDENHLRRLLTVLDIQDVSVFYKGNLRSLPYAAGNWREEFPERKRMATLPTALKPTTLVSFRDVKDHWIPTTQQWDSDEYVYIGRANSTYELPVSTWANPFKIEIDTIEARQEAIQKYRELHSEDNLFKEKLESLRGKTLVCWCKDARNPKPCHGDVLLEMLNEQPVQAPKQLTLFDDKVLSMRKRHYD